MVDAVEGFGDIEEEDRDLLYGAIANSASLRAHPLLEAGDEVVGGVLMGAVLLAVPELCGAEEAALCELVGEVAVDEVLEDADDDGGHRWGGRSRC